jgi:putative ABC transport system permease protein
MRLFALFAVMALALAAVGIYGVTSYMVAQRTHEIGIRVSLGAGTAGVMRMVIGRGILLALAGLVAGSGPSLVLMARTGGVPSTVGALTYTAVAVVLFLVAVAASWLPARRALKIDPLVALRHE